MVRDSTRTRVAKSQIISQITKINKRIKRVCYCGGGRKIWHSKSLGCHLPFLRSSWVLVLVDMLAQDPCTHATVDPMSPEAEDFVPSWDGIIHWGLPVTLAQGTSGGCGTLNMFFIYYIYIYQYYNVYIYIFLIHRQLNPLCNHSWWIFPAHQKNNPSLNCPSCCSCFSSSQLANKTCSGMESALPYTVMDHLWPREEPQPSTARYVNKGSRQFIDKQNLLDSSIETKVGESLPKRDDCCVPEAHRPQ